jgi:hypothetical protein
MTARVIRPRNNAAVTAISFLSSTEWGRGQGEGAFSGKSQTFDIAPDIKAPSPSPLPRCAGERKEK